MKLKRNYKTKTKTYWSIATTFVVLFRIVLRVLIGKTVFKDTSDDWLCIFLEVAIIKGTSAFLWSTSRKYLKNWICCTNEAYLVLEYPQISFFVCKILGELFPENANKLTHHKILFSKLEKTLDESCESFYYLWFLKVQLSAVYIFNYCILPRYLKFFPSRVLKAQKLYTKFSS